MLARLDRAGDGVHELGARARDLVKQRDPLEIRRVLSRKPLCELAANREFPAKGSADRRTLLSRGLTAKQVIADLVAAERYPAYRQLAVVDRDGRVATFEGAATLGVHNVAEGAACAAAGNLLADPGAYKHPARGDHAYAILTSVSQAAIDNLTPGRWHAAWKVLARAASVVWRRSL